MKKKKLIISCPNEHSEKLIQELGKLGIGTNGEYNYCFGRVQARGSFIAGEKSNPERGEKGKIAYVDEILIATVFNEEDFEKIYECIKKHHPYETPHVEVSDIDLIEF